MLPLSTESLAAVSPILALEVVVQQFEELRHRKKG
jgi:hypothetical protein